MTEDRQAGDGGGRKPERGVERQGAGDARAERLAAQLKANLRRRKEQARGRAEPGQD